MYWDRQQAVCAFAIGIIALLVYRLFSTYWQLKHIPGPLVAKFTDFHRFLLARRGFIHLYQARAHKQYGPVVRFGPNMVSFCDPEAIQTVFHMRTGFSKSKMYRAFRPWTPDGLLYSVFSAEDDVVNRQMKQHIAVYYSLSYTVSSFEERVDNAIRMFLDQLDRQFVATGTHCDMARWFKFFSYDAMALMTFSSAYGYLQGGNNFHVIMEDVKKSMLAIGPMTQIPWLDWLLHKNRVVSFIKREPVSALLRYVLARISERRESSKTLYNADKVIGPDAKNDFLGYFLQLQERKSDKAPVQFLTMWTLANILGGSDSTAAVLRSVVCSLVEHPDVLESVRAELRAKHTSTGLSLPIPKWNELQNLPLLDACIKESLRLEPPFAWVLERVVPEGGATICGRFVPGGTIVGMSPYITNRYPPTWGEDADLWRPRRWLEGDPAHIRKLEASLLSFGAGTRTCIGQHVAMFDIKKLVAAVVMKYDIDLINPRGKGDRYSWVIMPESVQVTIKKHEE